MPLMNLIDNIISNFLDIFPSKVHKRKDIVLKYKPKFSETDCFIFLALLGKTFIYESF
jgi:hypothetical protein